MKIKYANDGWFKGPIPKQIEELTQLNKLIMTEIGVTGIIPPQIGS